MLDVLMLMEARQVAVMMMKVKGQVTVKVLLEVKVMVFVVKEFVVEVEAVLLFSLSSTPNPRTTPSTRPAGRCLGLGR
jgi:hypothetical protein